MDILRKSVVNSLVCVTNVNSNYSVGKGNKSFIGQLSLVPHHNHRHSDNINVMYVNSIKTTTTKRDMAAAET